MISSAGCLDSEHADGNHPRFLPHIDTFHIKVVIDVVDGWTIVAPCECVSESTGREFHFLEL